jgi:hypothetical protein
MWEWIYQRSVIQVPLGHDVCASLKNQNLIDELIEERFVILEIESMPLSRIRRGKFTFGQVLPFSLVLNLVLIFLI